MTADRPCEMAGLGIGHRQRWGRYGRDIAADRRSALMQRVVAFYNQRGTCEQFIKEGKRRSNGPGCHAAPSLPTPAASSSMCSRITLEFDADADAAQAG